MGLVGDQDRSRVVARHGRARLSGAAWVPTGLRPDRTRHPRRVGAGVDWTDEECAIRLVQAAGRSLGVATVGDLAVYKGLPVKLVQPRPGRHGLRARIRAGLGAARVRRPRRHRCARPAGHDPQRVALALRFVDVGQGAHRTHLRISTPARGVRAAGEAPVRLFRHAGAGWQQVGGTGRPGPSRAHVGGQADHAADERARPAMWRRHSSMPRRGSVVTTWTSSGWSPVERTSEVKALVAAAL